MNRIEELNPLTRQLMERLINALAASPSIQSEMSPHIVLLIKQVRDLTRLAMLDAE